MILCFTGCLKNSLALQIIYIVTFYELYRLVYKGLSLHTSQNNIYYLMNYTG